MPIKIPEALPATRTLIEENIFVMTEKRALSQDIRPLHILLLNLMPTKIETETQLVRLIGNTPLQIELDLLQMESHTSTHVSQEHMAHFYTTFDQVKDNYYDGFIITGAPLEHLDYEEVEYWDELCDIMDWALTHVYSTLYICWGAFAGLYYYYGIDKKPLPEKLFGVYPHRVVRKSSILFRGFDDTFMVPHSRHITLDEEDVRKVDDLKILAVSDEAGLFAMSTEGGRQIFITGHSEYDQRTLEKEYLRDKSQGKPIRLPKNYYPDDDETREPNVSWRSTGNLFFANWINYIVYQTTPYDLHSLEIVREFRDRPSKKRPSRALRRIQEQMAQESGEISPESEERDPAAVASSHQVCRLEPKDFNLAKDMYLKLCEQQKLDQYSPVWRYGIYPADQDLIDGLAKGEYFVSFTDGSPSSIMRLSEEPDTLSLHLFGILPEYRKTGLSKIMMAFMEEEARKRGLSRLVLDVISENLPARRLYESLDFVCTGTRTEVEAGTLLNFRDYAKELKQSAGQTGNGKEREEDEPETDIHQ